MNWHYVRAMATLVFGLLLLFTAHPVWLLAMILAAMSFGWNAGKVLIPAEEA